MLILVGNMSLGSTKLSMGDSSLRGFLLMSGASSRSCGSHTSLAFFLFSFFLILFTFLSFMEIRAHYTNPSVLNQLGCLKLYSSLIKIKQLPVFLMN